MIPKPPILHLRPVPNLEIFMAEYRDNASWMMEVEQAIAEGRIPEEIHHIKRRIEWVVLQHLLKVAGIAQLTYLPNGKPEVIGPEHISISHGAGLAGIALASGPVGLDIQMPEPKLGLIRKKFCSPAELRFCEESDDPQLALTVIWAAKEAVFKCYGEKVHFARDIFVHPFEANDERISAHYSGTHGEKEFRLVHVVHAGHHCLCNFP